LRATSFDEWWTRTTALAGPVATVLAHLADDAMHALRARARERTEPYATPAGLEFPGLALLAVARRR
jgi:hypothetical protein